MREGPTHVYTLRGYENVRGEAPMLIKFNEAMYRNYCSFLTGYC